MKVLVLGAGGIIGQHLQCSVPAGIKPTFTRTVESYKTVSVDLTSSAERSALLDTISPRVIINLAGEARPDVVEKDPKRYREINERLPRYLCHWATLHRCYLLHVSTQGVFSGTHPPYGPYSPRNPVNEYGKQKRDAEDSVMGTPGFSSWCVVRPTFVLGARPDTRVGRRNPLEDILLSPTQRQVTNRWFSVSFAHDVAHCIWELALERPVSRIVHLGHPESFTRFQLSNLILEAAEISGTIVDPVRHEDFAGIAPRPIDTTYDSTAWHRRAFSTNLDIAIARWRDQLVGLLDEKGQYAGP